jgi:HEAT repeat protein
MRRHLAGAAAAALALLGPHTAYAVPADELTFEGKTLSAWVSQLSDKDAKARLAAANAIGEWGDRAKPAIPVLVAALKDTNEDVRNAAVNSLAAAGPDAVGPLIQAFRNRDAEVRRLAAVALGNQGPLKGPEAKDAVRDLTILLKDKDPGVRRAAVVALGASQPKDEAAASALIDLLRDKDADVRVAVLDALPRIDSALRIDHEPGGKIAIPVLVAALKDDSAASVRVAAARNLAYFRRLSFGASKHLGDKPNEVVTALVAALKDADADVRAAAVASLGHLGHDTEEEVGPYPLLRVLAKDKAPAVRAEAARALGCLGSHAPKRIAWELLEALKGDTDAKVRAAAADALYSFFYEEEDVLPGLIAALKDNEAEVRTAAAGALRFPKAKDAVKPLLGLLKDDENALVREVAASALGDIASDAGEVVPALAKALRGKESAVRDAAAWSLSAFGEPGSASLKDALKDDSAEVRRSAARALGSIDVGAKGVPDLIAALKDKDASVRAAAAGALPDGSDSREAIAALIGLLKDPDKEVRESVQWALARIGEDALNDLKTALKDKDVNVRRAAASALWSMSTQSKRALPELIGALKDDDVQVRVAAAGALGSIRADAEAALPALKAAADDRDVRVARSADYAIQLIQFDIERRSGGK